MIAEGLRMRAGPGTNYQQLGELPFGAAVEAIGRSADGHWWQIAYHGKAAWISGDYVVASLEAYALPSSLSPSPLPAAQQPSLGFHTPPSQRNDAPATAGGCPTGCTEQRPGCAIKDHVNARGERIYHIPGGIYYNRTSVRPGEGDRWFCTPAEAEANSFRPSAR